MQGTSKKITRTHQTQSRRGRGDQESGHERRKKTAGDCESEPTQSAHDISLHREREGRNPFRYFRTGSAAFLQKVMMSEPTPTLFTRRLNVISLGRRL